MQYSSNSKVPNASLRHRSAVVCAAWLTFSAIATASVSLLPAGRGRHALAYADDGRLGELALEITRNIATGSRAQKLLFRERVPGGLPGAWETLASAGPHHADRYKEAALTYTASGQPAVIYLDTGSRFRRAVRQPGGGWASEGEWTVPQIPEWFGSFPDSRDLKGVAWAFETNGTPHVLLRLTEFGQPPSDPLFVHARLVVAPAPTEWTLAVGPFTTSTGMGGFDYPGFENYELVTHPRNFALALDAAGGAHAVFSVNQTSVVVSGGTEVRSSLSYVMKPAGGAWSAPQTILSPGSSWGDGGIGASISIAPNGTVAVATTWLPRVRTGSPGVCELRYLVKQPNGSWTSSTVAAAADGYFDNDGQRGTGLSPLLIFDEHSHPRLTFADHASGHGYAWGAVSFSGQVRLATRTSATGGAWTLSKLINRGSAIPLDFQTFEPAIASRFGQTAVAATSWLWNEAQMTYLARYDIVLQGTITLPPPPLLTSLEWRSLSGGKANLRFHVNRACSWTVQSRENLSTGSWQDTQTGDATPPHADITGLILPSPDRGFFRVRATPAP